MTAAAPGRDLAAARALAAERLIGRLLIAVTYVSVGLLAVGVVLMITDSISPHRRRAAARPRRTWPPDSSPSTRRLSCGSAR